MSGPFSTSRDIERDAIPGPARRCAPGRGGRGRRRGGSLAAGSLAIALLAASNAAGQSPIGEAYRYLTTPPGRIAWIAGCWERRTGTRLVEEQWMAPRGGTMLGMSRTVRGDTLVEYEQLRIYERNGALVYAAHPSGQEPAEFVSTTVTDTMAVFENSRHDAPQRIVYRRLPGDSLAASVEGAFKGTPRVVSFIYARVPCIQGTAP